MGGFFFLDNAVITTNFNLKKRFSPKNFQGGCQSHSLGLAICIYM